MFGGDEISGPSNSTWVRTGNCWTELQLSVKPQTRSYAALAFDPIRRRSVMYGGGRADPGKPVVTLADTWEWDGTNWISVQASPSPILVSPVAAFDIATGQFVVYGFDETASQPNTWVWNGSQWLHLHPTSTPGARVMSSMAYDYSSRQIVLFGGFNHASGWLSDTWTWDGTTWTQQRPSVSPGSPALLCGGSPLALVATVGPNLGTWLWDSTTWKAIPTIHSPPKRVNSACTFTGTDLVLFGGWGQSGQPLSDLWLFNDLDWMAGR